MNNDFFGKVYSRDFLERIFMMIRAKDALDHFNLKGDHDMKVIRVHIIPRETKLDHTPCNGKNCNCTPRESNSCCNKVKADDQKTVGSNNVFNSRNFDATKFIALYKELSRKYNELYNRTRRVYKTVNILYFAYDNCNFKHNNLHALNSMIKADSKFNSLREVENNINQNLNIIDDILNWIQNTVNDNKELLNSAQGDMGNLLNKLELDKIVVFNSLKKHRPILSVGLNTCAMPTLAFKTASESCSKIELRITDIMDMLNGMLNKTDKANNYYPLDFKNASEEKDNLEYMTIQDFFKRMV